MTTTGARRIPESAKGDLPEEAFDLANDILDLGAVDTVTLCIGTDAWIFKVDRAVEPEVRTLARGFTL